MFSNLVHEKRSEGTFRKCHIDFAHLLADDHGTCHAHVVAFVDLDGAGFGLRDGGGAAIIRRGRHNGRTRHEAAAVPSTILALLRIQIR